MLDLSPASKAALVQVLSEGRTALLPCRKPKEPRSWKMASSRFALGPHTTAPPPASPVFVSLRRTRQRSLPSFHGARNQGSERWNLLKAT